MKKLDKFILKSFIGPFVAILLVVVFILLMQFLWLYIDELVGKGLSMKVILEFLGWGCATLLPLSLPLATLLSSMMTLGTLGENNELLAIKAAGISLQRILTPLALSCVVISIAAFFITNELVPVAYNKIYQLREDIGKTKEEIKEYITDNYYVIDFTLDDIRPTYDFNESCQGTVPQALEAFFESNSFEDAIRNAISVGGDSDTLAAITGGIAEAYYGIEDDMKEMALSYLDNDLLKVYNRCKMETSK